VSAVRSLFKLWFYAFKAYFRSVNIQSYVDTDSCFHYRGAPPPLWLWGKFVYAPCQICRELCWQKREP
jgi:hypothetical protein